MSKYTAMSSTSNNVRRFDDYRKNMSKASEKDDRDRGDDFANINIELGEYFKIRSKKVVQEELWKRPLNGSGKRALQMIGFAHEGVVVTLDDGSRYLIHKMEDKDGEAKIVVADAARINRNNGWKLEKVRQVVRPNPTLKDYCDTCSKHRYNKFTNNCMHAAKEMMCLGKKNAGADDAANSTFEYRKVISTKLSYLLRLKNRAIYASMYNDRGRERIRVLVRE